MTMNYDKINGDVCFRESDHKYFNIKNKDAEYTSVTTLIGKFHEKFDGDFWSKYKALEEIMGDEFKEVKPKLLNTKKIPEDVCFLYDVDEDAFNECVSRILEQYKQANIEGCERGTAYHLKKELEWYEKSNHKINTYTPSLCHISPDAEFNCVRNNWDLSRERAVMPEFLVYYSTEDGIMNLAGQVDLLIKDGNDLYILDFKTNAKGIKSEAYFDRKTKKYKTMFYPLNTVKDTMLMHYTLQLSLYAWMLQQINPEFNIKLLQLLHVDGDGNESQITVDYLKDEVERMLKFYKKELIANKEKEKW